MTNALMELMWERFIAERDNYLRLRNDLDQRRSDRDKVLKRLGLLKKLLELEGESVSLPEGTKR